MMSLNGMVADGSAFFFSSSDSAAAAAVMFKSTFRGGLHGDGIDRNIKELYRFLASNYDAGDEIYVSSFTRGCCSLSWSPSVLFVFRSNLALAVNIVPCSHT